MRSSLAMLRTTWAPKQPLSNFLCSVSGEDKRDPRGTWGIGKGCKFMMPLSSHSTPTAAGPPVHLGGSDSKLFLLHTWLACPFPTLVAGT